MAVNPLLTLTERYRIVLASGSPRRRELMSMLDVNFEIDTSHSVQEVCPPELDVRQIPQYLSQLKASAFSLKENDDRLIVTADTVVLLGDKILGKPADADDAKRMLAEMAAKEQTVITGVTVTTADRQISFSDSTIVEFAPLSAQEIDFYVDKFVPLDKAGAYGIQEWIGAAAIRRIDGSFYNVMGLPIHRLYTLLKNLQ